MKKFIVILVSLVAVFWFSCGKRIDYCGDYELLGLSLLPRPISYLPSIDIVEPVKTNFRNGIFTIDFKIESDFKGEAYIAMILRHRQVDNKSVELCYPVKGFGSDVKVYDYQIRSYHPVYATQCRRDIYDKLILDYPVFLKKINVPKGTIGEKIRIRLPNGVKDCFGEILVFRNNKALEESMKTKVGSTESFSNQRLEIYRNHFPDSSMFSFIITNRTSLERYSEYDGHKTIINPWAFDCSKLTIPTKGYTSHVNYFLSPYNDLTTDEIHMNTGLIVIPIYFYQH